MLVCTMFLGTLIVLSIIYLANATDDECHKLLNTLAINQSDLIRCITKNAVPVNMCTGCKGNYEDLIRSYDFLVANCSSLYFDKDRINIIASTETMLASLWSKAFCDDCFNNNNNEIFNEKYSALYTCLQNTKYEPCKICKIQYSDLNNFYINLDQHNNGEVCYDIQDSMNRTRNKWSKELKCCRRNQNLTLFTLALGIISIFPVMFYGSTYLITKHQERNHGVLNDDDPIYNSELPTSSRRNNISDINNSTQLINENSSSNSYIKNTSASPTFSSVDNKGNIDLESSDDDIQIDVSVNSKSGYINIFK